MSSRFSAVLCHRLSVHLSNSSIWIMRVVPTAHQAYTWQSQCARVAFSFVAIVLVSYMPSTWSEKVKCSLLKSI